MHNENPTKNMDVDEAFEALVVAESERLFRVLSRVGQVLACFVGLALGCLVYQLIHHKARVEYARYHLDKLNASHLWQHETFSRVDKSDRQRKKTMRTLANVFGDSTVSGFSVVGIDQPDATDQDLGFLSQLRELRTLRLTSNKATNATICAVSQLPNLRYLQLLGEQFSIHGLLQLRSAKNLRELTIEKDAFTPIELAVLHAELPGVTVNERAAPAKQSAAPKPEHQYSVPTLPFANTAI
ncbi:MAG: hypothetical protein Aurels2KO_04050 [Aureliella sp.]